MHARTDVGCHWSAQTLVEPPEIIVEPELLCSKDIASADFAMHVYVRASLLQLMPSIVSTLRVNSGELLISADYRNCSKGRGKQNANAGNKPFKVCGYMKGHLSDVRYMGT